MRNWEIDMVDIKPIVDREGFYALNQSFEDGKFAEGVQKYLDELNQTKERMRKEWHRATYFYSIDRDVVRRMGELLDKEIEYCTFYLETQERKKEPNFNQWTFIKREDVEFNSYDKKIADGEQWVKTNGKVKATIAFDRTKKTVGIEVRFANDSHKLDFTDYHENAEICKKSHVKSPESIQKRVEEYKKYADKVIMEHQFPSWTPEKTRFDLLKKLLNVECKSSLKTKIELLKEEKQCQL